MVIYIYITYIIIYVVILYIYIYIYIYVIIYKTIIYNNIYIKSHVRWEPTTLTYMLCSRTLPTELLRFTQTSNIDDICSQK